VTTLILIADDAWGDICGVFVLGVVDSNEIWHNLHGVWSGLDFSALHNLHLQTDNTLTKFD